MNLYYPSRPEVRLIAIVVIRKTNQFNVYVKALGRFFLMPVSARPIVCRTANEEALQTQGWGDWFGKTNKKVYAF